MSRRNLDDDSYKAPANVSGVLAEEKRHIGVCEPCWGLALSGGGIRSAAFSLGVLQALARGKILRSFDYMSTVSGGGYIGCSLTWWLSQGLPKGGKSGTGPEDFPFSLDTDSGKAIVNFLRLHGNYLLPEAALNLTSMFAVLLRNVVVAFLVYFTSFTVLILTVEMLVDFVVYAYSPIVQLVFPGTQSNGTESTVHHFVDAFRETVEGSLWLQALLFAYLTFMAVLAVQSTLKSRFWQARRLAFVVIAIAFMPARFLVDIIYVRLCDIIPNLKDTELQIIRLMIYMDVYLWISFIIGSILYSLLTLFYQLKRRTNREDTNSDTFFAWNYRRYDERTFAQKIFGKTLTLSIVLLVASALGVMQQFLYQAKSFWMIMAALILPVIGLAITFSSVGVKYLTLKNQRIVPVGAWLFISGSVLWAFMLVHVVNRYLTGDEVVIWGWILTLGAILLWAGIGFFVNVNYFGIHRMYRDRLMELFLPDREAVETGLRQYANVADRTTLASICDSPCRRPYHLINTNVVLVDSSSTKYRGRGGDNFILSPLYCGSSATGWRRSKNYLTDVDPGVTLATAMAISGAAASPNTGRYGLTRDRSNSLLMSVLGLRLGYWAPNPNPKISSSRPPNFFFPGIASVALGSLKEDRKVIDLTDGGHFENLGLYELIRRKLRFVVVCDSSADPSYAFRELTVAINRVKVDFGVSIRFSTTENEPKDVNTPEGVTSQLRNELAAQGFASAKIIYEDGTQGQLIYLKPTLMNNLSIEIYSYKARHSDFPHEATYNQFFDEDQFEAYRELGFHLGYQFTQHYEGNPDDPPPWSGPVQGI